MPCDTPDPSATRRTLLRPESVSYSCHLLCAPQRELNFATRCFLRLFDEDPQHENATTDRRYVNRASNSVSSFQPHLPKGTFQMFDVRLANVLKPEALNQPYDALEACAHVRRESFQLRTDLGVREH